MFHRIHEIRVPYITENPLLCPFKVSQFVIKLAKIFEHHHYFACLLYSIARNNYVCLYSYYIPCGSGTSLMVIMAISALSGIVTAESEEKSSITKFSSTSKKISDNRLMVMHSTSP